MASDDLKGIIEAAKELDYPIDPQYSGRGMMGRMCISVMVPTFRDIGRFMFMLGAVNQGDEYNMTELVFDYRTDNMGREYVLYWPLIEVPVEVADQLIGEDYDEGRDAESSDETQPG